MKIDDKTTLLEHPENFICDVCGKTKNQAQTVTHRRGWPICHQMTMKEHKARELVNV